MKLRRMSDLYNLTNVAKDCNDFITNMKLKNLYEAVNPEDLDQGTLRHFLEQRINRLETFLIRCILNSWEWLSACFG